MLPQKNGLKSMANSGYFTPMKWSCGPLLMTARRPTLYGMICMDLRPFDVFCKSSKDLLSNAYQSSGKMTKNVIT